MKNPMQVPYIPPNVMILQNKAMQVEQQIPLRQFSRKQW